MTQERINWTVKVITRSIRYYQKKLAYQLELGVEDMFHNGLRKSTNIGDMESNIKTYETIIGDLGTIRRAISKGISHANIYSFDEERGALDSPQIYDVLVNRAKLHVEGLDGELYFVAEEDAEAAEKYGLSEEAQREWDAHLESLHEEG